MDTLTTCDSATTPRIGAIAPWFGGKRVMAPLIAKELGHHRQYFEPFCGSMAVLFAKDHVGHETVNDLHDDLINLARVVADGDQAPRLYKRLQRTLFCEELLRDAAAVLNSTRDNSPSAIPNMTRAYWYFLTAWMGRNGEAGTTKISYSASVRWTPNGGSPTVRFQSAVDSLPWWHRRLSNVVILNRDAFEVINSAGDTASTALYIDSPYTADTRGTAKYLHDFESGGGMFAGADDHERLRDALERFKNARVVVSYYDSPRVRELYAGWTFVECSRHKHLTTTAGSNGQKNAPEILILNGESWAK